MQSKTDVSFQQSDDAQLEQVAEHVGSLGLTRPVDNRGAANFDLTGRCVLVTGGARGIGCAIARALAAAGAAVAVQDIDADAARKTVEQFKSFGYAAVALDGDALLDLSAPARLVEQTVDALGGLQILVNNASIQTPASWLVQDPAEMERQLRADVIAPILFCRSALPHLKDNASGRGRIINLGSVQQRGANPGMLAYSLSKGALEKLTIGLAHALATDRITVNQIAPGWIADTERNRKDLNTAEKVAQKGDYIPLGRLGFPVDMAGVAVLLASDAGAYITGQSIFVDGGMR